MATMVFVQKDGIVNHKHNGVGGYHNPAAKHKNTRLHFSQHASSPSNSETLTPEMAEQYALALGGQSFYDKYKAAIKNRREQGLVPCDLRCTSAHPDSECNCQCGGTNHGSTFVTVTGELVDSPE